MSAHPYELLSALLEYPDESAVAQAEECRAALAKRSPEAASQVEGFGLFAASAEVHELEELYVGTFDFEPAHCLDLGNQLFGESYKRGSFLVSVQEAVKEAGVEFGGKLADHLTVVLRLLIRLEPARARSLVDEAVLPAVDKVLGTMRDASNPYRMLLEAVKAVLAADYGIQHIRPVPEARPLELPGAVPPGPPLMANRHEEEGSAR
ncbi:MAG: nitrate reductase [Myxococcales bacterium]|nr:nitrate reductase [Myxococcales bacterium]